MVKLKDMRQAKGLSQIQLAEKAGINVRTLQHYEQENSPKIFDHARIDTIVKCAIALECKIDEIIDNDEYVELLREYEKSQS